MRHLVNLYFIYLDRQRKPESIMMYLWAILRKNWNRDTMMLLLTGVAFGMVSKSAGTTCIWKLCIPRGIETAKILVNQLLPWDRMDEVMLMLDARRQKSFGGNRQKIMNKSIRKQLLDRQSSWYYVLRKNINKLQELQKIDSLLVKSLKEWQEFLSKSGSIRYLKLIILMKLDHNILLWKSVWRKLWNEREIQTYLTQENAFKTLWFVKSMFHR